MRNPEQQVSHINRSYQIYALIDPRDNLVRYVGLSISADVRFIGHLKGNSGNEQEKRWILELQLEGLTPMLQILETIEAGSNAYAIACEEELYWIREMARLGYPLFNLSGLSRTYVPATIRKPRALETRKIILDNEGALEIESSLVVDIVDVPSPDSEFAMSQDEEMLTTDEVAKQLRVNVKTVRNWIATGELIAVDIGNEYRISRTNLNRFIEKRQTDKRDR